MTLGRLIELYKAEQEGKQIIFRIIQFTLDKKLEWNDKLLKFLPISAWCKLYKTDLLKTNKIYFADNKLKFEDFYFWYILKNQLKSVYIFYGSTYFYRQRNDSTMSVNKYNKNDCLPYLHKCFAN